MTPETALPIQHDAPLVPQGPYLVVSITDVKVNGNVRGNMDPAALKDLVDSIQEKGVLQPITISSRRTVKEGEPRYTVVTGHRRLEAAKIAGLKEIPALLRQVDKIDELLEIQVIENLQREDLEPMDEAFAYHRLCTAYKLSALDIAKRVGKSQEYVWNRIRLVTHLEEKGKNLLRSKVITVGHAILLSRLAPADQKRAMQIDRFGRNHGQGLLRTETTLFDAKPQIVCRTLPEFRDWIDQNVRFDPGMEALGDLFPNTATALKAADVNKLRVIPITRDYMLPAEARSKERTYTERSWREVGKIHCDYEVLGVIVAGEGRGQAFPVCIRKDVCTKHWGKELAEKKKAMKSATAGGKKVSAKELRQQEEDLRKKEEERQEERDRQWKAALPELKKALFARLKSDEVTPTSLVGKLFLQNFRDANSKEILAALPKENTAEWMVRVMTASHVLESANWGGEWVRQRFEAMGVNVKATIEATNHTAIEEKKTAAKKAKTAKKK